jgi:DNA repair protein RadC
MASKRSQLDLTLPLAKDATATFQRRPSRTRVTAPAKEPIAMSTADLFTAILGPASAAACMRVLAEHLSVREVAGLYPPELRQYGFTARAIEKLSAVFEMAKRYGKEEFVPGQPFRGSADVYGHYRERLADEVVEHFFVILLDNKHRKLRDVLLSLGSLTASIVHPRDVYARIIREAAASVIFVHNHPSGDPTPSAEDLEITRRLREVGDLIGVRVLDHIVIGKGRYVSFVDDGYW